MAGCGTEGRVTSVNEYRQPREQIEKARVVRLERRAMASKEAQVNGQSTHMAAAPAELGLA
jgi:hypothetical protein